MIGGGEAKYVQHAHSRKGRSIKGISRANASWLGVPCSKRMNWRRNASLHSAQSAMSTQVCPPHRLESTAIIKSCRVALLVRGSSTPLNN